MKFAIAIAGFVVAVFPQFSSADIAPVLTNVGNFIAGESCRVPIFHTDFAFPPEGGQIVRNGDQLYFIRTYVPGCENAAAFGTPVPTTSGVNTFPGNQAVVTSPAPSTQEFSAPVTGCSN